MNARIPAVQQLMIDTQIRPIGVDDPAVLDALVRFPRSGFVLPGYLGLACADTHLPVGCEQLMLSPVQEARFLQALQLQKAETVLEIGTGSGYFTAMLSELAARVISVEYHGELSTLAGQRLAEHNIDNVELHTGDAAQGWETDDRLDVIVITAAYQQLPDCYLQQLKIGGRLLVVEGSPPAMTVKQITRRAEREWQTRNLFETVIPYMIHAEPVSAFEF